MFENLKERFVKFITSRQVFLCGALIIFACILVCELFVLQIVEGEQRLNDFKLKVQKEKTIPAARGNIYDRNGNLLAYNDIANCVTIFDVFTGDKHLSRSQKINRSLNRAIDIIEENGDTIDMDFGIILNEDTNQYEFLYDGQYSETKHHSTKHLGFLRDVYGVKKVDDLYDQKKKLDRRENSANQVMDDLCEDFEIGSYQNTNQKGKPQVFIPGLNYSKKRALQLVALRYKLRITGYQKYIPVTIASDVNDRTVSAIMENADILEGISIEDKMVRKYSEDDSECFAHLLGYTGAISPEELTAIQEKDPDTPYDMNDSIGKSGIEKLMEDELQGTKGSETIFVDNMGKELAKSDHVDPSPGNDVYLTIDRDLTIACYKIIEHDLATILVDKIKNIKFGNTDPHANSKDIDIPIYDVYFTLFDNYVIDISHLSAADALINEQEVYKALLAKKESVLNQLRTELTQNKTPYERLPQEYKWYMTYIASKLSEEGWIKDDYAIINDEVVDKKDPVYVQWATEETISLSEYLEYAIAQDGWIDTSGLKNLENEYSDSEEIYNEIVNAIIERLDTDVDFQKRLFKYMLLDENISGDQVCNILIEQDESFKEKISDEELDTWLRGGESPYTFLINRIKNHDLTPAQLALDPCTASMVVTDVNTGDVLALVTYPGYDNNKMANGVDPDYYAALSKDLSKPLLNHATQEKTAPGSTFKMVSATAGLMEGVITTKQQIHCGGIFNKLSNPPKCWKSGGHGSLDVANGIRNSCNVFFYEIGYRLGTANGEYNVDVGLGKLAKYAQLYGLNETSGIGIEESTPNVSNKDAVRSAIGQGTANYTTVGLARYVTTVANSGTCYNLNLIDRTTNSNGNTVKDYKAEVRNKVELPQEYWNAIHTGMRGVVLDKPYYNNLGIDVAGKTGTAQQSGPNHSLFVCYAPYENPKIAVATRIVRGYTSSYAAQFTRDALAYYFGREDLETEILSDTKNALQDGAALGD